MSVSDTIVAIASGAGAGGIGVVRLSGPAVQSIARALIGSVPKPRYAYYTAFRDANGGTLDHGLALYFPRPNSFTGESVLELHAHGSPILLNMLLRRVCELGARQAQAGEFSQRAFLNNKLDLTQAEAIADLIASESEAAARAALRSLEGEFSNKVHKLLHDLIKLRVNIEAAIDFPEEEIDFLEAPQVLRDLITLRTQLTDLLAATQRGVVLRDGLHVVIVGAPNAGKSSLLNALAQTDRAIVTSIPGTTRDTLREVVHLDGIALTLVDTAGLREANDPVEREGIRRALVEVTQADVVLLVSDTVEAYTGDTLLTELPKTATCLILHNKIDLGAEIPHVRIIGNATHVWLSAQTGAGLNLLRTELKRLAGQGEGNEGAFTARSRHVIALEKVANHLASADAALRQTHAGEIAAEELRGAQTVLNSITGEFSSDDLLGEIFSTFCVGK